MYNCLQIDVSSGKKRVHRYGCPFSLYGKAIRSGNLAACPAAFYILSSTNVLSIISIFDFFGTILSEKITLGKDIALSGGMRKGRNLTNVR
jgi:hypothetical protein